MTNRETTELKDMKNVILRVEGIALRFGGVQALQGVTFQISEGELVSIIGPNGAGKTSIINCINGFYRPQSGEIYFDGRRITRLAPHKIAELGISRTFQNLAVYSGMTTIDNILAGCHTHMKSNAISSWIWYGLAQREEIEYRRKVEDIIDFLDMKSIRSKPVGSLPYGLRKRVELARALALEPKLLLLDEPMAGMNAEEKEDTARFILDILERQGTTILLIEHDMRTVMDISDKIIAFDFGGKIAEGNPEEIMCNREVIRAYLGTQ